MMHAWPFWARWLFFTMLLMAVAVGYTLFNANRMAQWRADTQARTEQIAACVEQGTRLSECVRQVEGR
jgi:hypothetical protein